MTPLDWLKVYYRHGERMTDAAEYGRLFKDKDYQRVAQTFMVSLLHPSKTAEVSTVWLGLDHNFGDSGDPLIFETMVFEESETHELCWRYSTEEQARQGHRDAIREVKEQLLGLSFITHEKKLSDLF